jgi:GNAT superfamily N-acetyltransferase
MALATWWSDDPLPQLSPLPGLWVGVSIDEEEIARINRIPLEKVGARLAAGHQPYFAYLEGAPVSYGWVATRTASIGELELAFTLPSKDRYLWDFATLPQWQGRGLYPRLLQAILEAESEAEHFWIIHAPENLPSGAGMNKAGFEPVGTLSFRIDGSVGLAPISPLERAQAGAKLLGVPLIDTVLAPCWHCGSTVEQRATEVDPGTCWPPLRPDAVTCNCATPVKFPAR